MRVVAAGSLDAKTLNSLRRRIEAKSNGDVREWERGHFHASAMSSSATQRWRARKLKVDVRICSRNRKERTQKTRRGFDCFTGFSFVCSAGFELNLRHGIFIRSNKRKTTGHDVVFL
mmetsp:Transcript_68632/g.103486  ORF Transcript_68632/g.103486 Transcript_68632/m.103486 type:complete len:117 (+) Transcript_68632:427-777(+)